MRIAFLMWDPSRIYLLLLCATSVCYAQRSIKHTVLAERQDWLDPSNRFDDEPRGQIDAGEHIEAETDQKTLSMNPNAVLDPATEKKTALATCERLLSRCEAQLLRFQMTADATNNGELTTDMVYLRKWIKSIMTRLEGGYLNQKDTPGRLELSFRSEDIEEFRTLLSKLDARSASQISSKMNELIINAEVSFDYREKPSKIHQLWLSISDLLSDVNVLTIIRFAILLLTGLFLVIIFTSRSKAFTFGYTLFFIFWLSYFWYWQNLLRRSEADFYLMNQKNPCENTKAWYNPIRYIESDSKECQEYLRRQFTPAHMQYSPIEVLLQMLSEYTSKAISLGVANLLSGLGLAIREFADQQSWFSVVPAFSLLFGFISIMVFKGSGMAISFFGCRLESSGARPTPQYEPIRMPERIPVHDPSEQFLLDNSRGMFPAMRTPRYLEDAHPVAFSQSEGHHCRLPESTSTFSTAAIANRSTEMPPPLTSAVPRRGQFDEVLLPEGHRQPTRRSFATIRAAGDYRPAKDEDDDDQAYDTANDDSDM